MAQDRPNIAPTTLKVTSFSMFLWLRPSFKSQTPRASGLQLTLQPNLVSQAPQSATSTDNPTFIPRALKIASGREKAPHNLKNIATKTHQFFGRDVQTNSAHIFVIVGMCLKLNYNIFADIHKMMPHIWTTNIPSEHFNFSFEWIRFLQTGSGCSTCLMT